MTERKTEAQLLLQEAEFFATPFLEQGRGGWDLAHTKAVVHYAGLLAENEGEDKVVLQTTGWLHDIGYFGQFTEIESKKYETIKDKKALHMVIGAEKAREFLEKDVIKSLLSAEQRERIIYLVGIHDKLEELKTKDELILMEADTLGAIDLDRVTPSFDKEGRIKYAAGLKERRKPKFITKLGIELLDQLLPKFKEYDPIK